MDSNEIKEKYIALLEQRIKDLEEKEAKNAEKPISIYINCPHHGSGWGGGTSPTHSTPYLYYGGGSVCSTPAVVVLLEGGLIK